MRRSSIPPLSSSSNNLESDVKCDQIMLVKPRNFAFDSFFDSSPETIFIQISMRTDREDLGDLVALFINIVVLFILFFFIYIFFMELGKRDFI